MTIMDTAGSRATPGGLDAQPVTSVPPYSAVAGDRDSVMFDPFKSGGTDASSGRN